MDKDRFLLLHLVIGGEAKCLTMNTKVLSNSLIASGNLYGIGVAYIEEKFPCLHSHILLCMLSIKRMNGQLHCASWL